MQLLKVGLASSIVDYRVKWPQKAYDPATKAFAFLFVGEEHVVDIFGHYRQGVLGGFGH